MLAFDMRFYQIKCGSGFFYAKLACLALSPFHLLLKMFCISGLWAMIGRAPLKTICRKAM
jgi:hypothetical protein